MLLLCHNRESGTVELMPAFRPMSDTPYQPPATETPAATQINWRYKTWLAGAGAFVGISLPLANVVRNFLWLRSQPDDVYVSGTPLFWSLVSAGILCPVLGLLLGAIGAIFGAGIDFLFRRTVAEHQDSDS